MSVPYHSNSRFPKPSGAVAVSRAAFRWPRATIPSRVQPHEIGMSRRYPPVAGLGNLRACCLPSSWSPAGRHSTMARLGICRCHTGREGTHAPMGYPERPLPIRANSSTSNGWPIGSPLDRWPGLPCTAPVADDSWRTRPVSTHATVSRQLSFESFLAPYGPLDRRA